MFKSHKDREQLGSVRHISERTAMEFSTQLQNTTFIFKKSRKFKLRTAKTAIRSRKFEKSFKKFDDKLFGKKKAVQKKAASFKGARNGPNLGARKVILDRRKVNSFKNNPHTLGVLTSGLNQFKNILPSKNEAGRPKTFPHIQNKKMKRENNNKKFLRTQNNTIGFLGVDRNSRTQKDRYDFGYF